MAVDKAETVMTDRLAIAVALDEARRADGLSQFELAGRLGTSQANISKILRGLHQPRPRLAHSIHGYLGPRSARRIGGAEEGKERLLKAYQRSLAFKGLVDAALLLMNENE